MLRLAHTNRNRNICLARNPFPGVKGGPGGEDICRDKNSIRIDGSSYTFGGVHENGCAEDGSYAAYIANELRPSLVRKH